MHLPTSPNRYTVVLLVMLFVGDADSWSYPSTERVDATQGLTTASDIKNKAKQLFDNDGVVVVSPVFDIKGGVLSFYLGKVFVKAAKYPDYVREPIRVPLQAQLRIELLRRFFSESGHHYIEFWESYLVSAEKVIGVMMDEIHSNSSDQVALGTTLALREGQVEKILEQAIQIFASTKNLTFKQVQEVRGKIINVKFRSDPPGAEMKMVQGFLYQAAGDSLSESLWRDVSGGNNIQMYTGDWQIKRRWSKNDAWEYGLESVNFDGEYTIKRKPR